MNWGRSGNVSNAAAAHLPSNAGYANMTLQSPAPSHLASSRSLLIVSVAIGAAVIGAAGAIFVSRALTHNPASAEIAASINNTKAKIDIPTRTMEMTSEKALRVRDAIRHGDYATASKISAAVLADSHLQNWRFYPFGDFIKEIANVTDPEFENYLNAWVAQNSSDAMPLLVRARYYRDLGWYKRGGHFARDTQAEHMAAFEDDMKKGLADTDAALRFNDPNPYAFYLKLGILRGFGPSQAMMDAFAAGIEKYPNYYPLYDVVLGTLEPEWGGSVKQMYAFVDQYAAQADEHSPLKLLYLSLYRSLLRSASIACARNGVGRDEAAKCVAGAMQKIVKPDLENRVVTALQLYDHTDRYQFGVALDEILSDMLLLTGGDVYSGAFLQLAATSMHSDTQLKEDNTDHNNNYIIDKAVSQSWYSKGFYDNSLHKDLEALKDAQAATFPSEAEKDLAIADVYVDIGSAYKQLNQYADMIAYEQAAVAIGGKTGDEHLICFGYYRLKDYDNAIKSCTKTIEDEPGNLQAYYWRGVSYRDLNRGDDALKDFAIVADSESDFRASAAINASMVYFNRNDNRGALDVLNRYQYLYDPSTTKKDDVAVGYNNRCYAYMQLGQLKEALDDCTASLKYGSIPDAYRKQQELVKRLGGG
jgi:hypothetical protein